ncbi:hypothetical protein AAFF_G00037990 [Aldrovandia affinis]|uniref:Aftiphilin clathrin-binding box domain-containing protein n=1 Tax=Aldrovandia affinis TaxID=143900 RepID=A0AAD7WZ58_9TELE|nr:hypothetical protein AAFF_G00037990 [Aldrovandia affinis]
MLQQNNNNNYPCLERACGSREALRERERSVLPFARLLEMGSFHELGDPSGRGPVRGFRAWAMSNVCARSRRWAALPPRNPAPCQPNDDVVGNLRPQKSQLTQGQGLRLEASAWGSRSSRNGQGGLGALVTVATLKASERGGQTQTQCFLLQARGRNYLCAAGRRRALAPGLLPEPQSSPAGRGGVEKGSEQREGAAAVGTLKVKPRPVRKWRTSCEVASSAHKERAHWDCENKGFPALEEEEGQGNWAKRASCSSRQDAQAGQQDDCGTETSGAAPAKICTQCRGLRDGPAIVLKRTAENRDQSSSGVEGDKLTSPTSGPCVCRLPPDPVDLETGSSNGERQGPIKGDLQEGLQTKSSTPVKVSRFQDLLGDKSPRLGASGKGETPGPLRNVGNSEAGCTGTAREYREGEIESKTLGETETFPDNDFEGHRTDGGMDSVGRRPEEKGGLLGGYVAAADVQESWRGREDVGPSPARLCPAVRKAHLVAGCVPAEVEDAQQRKQRPTLSDGSSGEAGDARERSVENEDREQATGLPADSPPRASGGQTVAGGHTAACPPVTKGIAEAGLLDGHSGGERTKSGGHPGGWDGAGEAPSSASGGGRGEAEGDRDGNAIWQLSNSLSHGPDSAAAAAATHAPPNLAPPGAMATDHSAPGGWQAGDGGGGGGGAAVGGEQQQQGWQGGMVAGGEGSLDVEQEGDDEFGLFMRAGEQPCWDDGFTDFHRVPRGRSESAALADPVGESEPAYWTSGEAENLFHQSEDTWTAFSQEGGVGLEPGLGAGQQQMQSGCQWWPQKAVEELSTVKLHTSIDMPSVFLKAFPSTPPSCPNPSPVVSVRQLLQGHSCEDSTDGDTGSLLDRLQDVNRIIGLKCKWAESHSQKLLLQSLHLDVDDKRPFQDRVTGSRLANDSPSVGLPPLSQRTPPTGNGKTRHSYDVNKDVLA